MAESLLTLIKRGGFFYDIEGASPKEVLCSFVEGLVLPAGLDKKTLLAAVLEREDLQPTSIGRGIALPHPRNPLLTDAAAELIAVGFTKEPVPWQALDGEAVRTLFLVISASAKGHLHTLSRIHYLCEQDILCGLLKSAAEGEMIMPYIIKAEKAWAD